MPASDPGEVKLSARSSHERGARAGLSWCGSFWRRLSWCGLSWCGLGLIACGPDLPASWPEESAASPAAEPAPPAVVTQAVSEHPPLPGEVTSGWAGLAAPEGGAHPHEGHDHPDHAHEGHKPSSAGPAGGEQGDPAAVRYSCPMHPDVVSDRPGQCPRCGMGLVKSDASK